MARLGAGTGKVTSSPKGINCGDKCSATYPAETVVTLTAKATKGSTFGGWGGACSGMVATCYVTVSAAVSVTAAFDPP